MVLIGRLVRPGGRPGGPFLPRLIVTGRGADEFGVSLCAKALELGRLLPPN